MKRNRGATAFGIAKLFVRSALTDFGETEFDEDGNDFTGLENGDVAHYSSDCDVLDSDKLGLQQGLTILQEHCNNVVQVVVDFVQRFPLGMCPGETGNKTNVQAGL